MRNLFTWITCLIAAAYYTYGGIPEPGIVLYGSVRDQQSGERVTWGVLTWSYAQPSSGDQVTITAEVSDLDGDACYVAQIPFERHVTSDNSSPNALEMKTSPVTYQRSASLDSLSAPESGGGQTDTVSVTNRGSFRRVDLIVDLSARDFDGDGIPDSYELGNALNPTVGNPPDSNLDGDAFSDLDEYHAGTRANDSSSLLQLEDAGTVVGGGRVFVTWQSASNRTYMVRRSTNNLLTFVTVATGIPATPPSNTFTDAVPAAVGGFYQVIKE